MKGPRNKDTQEEGSKVVAIGGVPEDCGGGTAVIVAALDGQGVATEEGKRRTDAGLLLKWEGVGHPTVQHKLRRCGGDA